MSGKYAVLYKKAFGKVKYSLEMYKEMGAATQQKGWAIKTSVHPHICTPLNLEADVPDASLGVITLHLHISTREP